MGDYENLYGGKYLARCQNPRKPLRFRRASFTTSTYTLSTTQEWLYHWCSFSVGSENRDNKLSFMSQAVTAFRPLEVATSVL